MTAHQDVVDALDKLAAHGTADQIASHLAENGHRGTRRRAASCPVANYVLSTTGQSIAVCQIDWGPRGRGEGESYDVPDAIGDFVTQFDRGNYPDLTDAPLVARWPQ